MRSRTHGKRTTRHVLHAPPRRGSTWAAAGMRTVVLALVALALCGCVMPVRRSLEMGVGVGDQLRTEVRAAITTCYQWRATSPISTRQEHVPCLAAWPDDLPEGAMEVAAGTIVNVVKLRELGLIDSGSTQVFVAVPGHAQALLVPMGDMGRLFPGRRRHGR